MGTHKVTRRTFLQVAGAVTGGVILSACAPPAAAPSSAPADTAAPAGGESTTAGGPTLRGEQVLRLPFGGSVWSLDPGESSHFWIPEFTIYAGLTRHEQDGSIGSHMAEGWEVSDDGTVYTFHINPEAKWSNGEKLTAADFVWTWQRNLDPARPGYSYDYILQPIKGAQEILDGSGPLDGLAVVALDDLTLEVTLVSPSNVFPSLMAEPMAAPLHRQTLEDNPDNPWAGDHAVSTGPFTVQDYVEKSHLFLKKNPNYIGPGPHLERIEYLIGGNALLQYENGEVDWAGPGAELQRVREDPVLSQELTEYPYKGLFFFYAKFAAPGLDDVRIRKALAMAIDRETYCRVVANETCLPNGGFLPLTIAYFAPDIGVQFDPEGAKQLLADAGYPNGEGFPPVTIIHWYDQPEVEFVKQQLEANLGLTVVIDRVEVGLATSRSFDVDNPAALQPQGWEASYNDPYGWYGGGILSGKSTASGGWYLPRHALTLEQMQGYNELIASVEAETDAAKKAELTQQLVTLEQSNTPDWVTEYVALAEEAVASTDEARRQEIWSQVQQIMFDNMPIIPMHTVRSFVLKKPHVKNMMVHPLLPNHGLYMNETYIDMG